jgi:hypothetical protein
VGGRTEKGIIRKKNSFYMLAEIHYEICQNCQKKKLSLYLMFWFALVFPGRRLTLNNDLYNNDSNK